MIKEVFLPEKIGARRIIPQHILGIAIHENCVRFALVYAKQHKSFVERLLVEPIEPGTDETLVDRTAQAIKRGISSIKSYDQIRACISASNVVFKEVQLQFDDPEKIRMVLDYEIEAMLPFSIQEAVVDFIITKPQKDQEGSQVLVAAVRSQELENFLNIYKQAGIEPTSVTIDLFAVFGLYQQIAEYRTIPHACALVEIDDHATRIAFVQDGQLRLNRSVQRGFQTVIKLISEETKIPVQDVVKKLETTGLSSTGDDVVMRAMQKHFVLLLNEIQFTLNSFSLKLNFYDGVSKILFTGDVGSIANFMTFCSDTMQIPCEVLDCKKLLDGALVKNKAKDVAGHWSDYSVALGVALPSNEQCDFDLRRKQFVYPRSSLIIKQLATVGILVFLILLTLGVKGYFDISRLSSEASQFELQEIGRFKTENIFTKEQLAKKRPFPAVVRDAEKVVNEKREIWAPFSQQRMRPLELWVELTRLINKKQLDVTIREVTFTTDEKNWEKEKDGTTKKDAGVPKVEAEGLFKSKTGDHFIDFMRLFESRFKESATLKVIEPIDATPAPDGGVNFTVRMRLKDI